VSKGKSTTAMNRPLRLFFAAGPGDVLGTYSHWKSGDDDPSQIGLTYSGQFFDVVKQLGAEAMVVSSNPRRADRYDEQFVIQHRPTPLRDRGGLLYHVGQTYASARIVWKAWRFGADVLIVADATGHWFPFRAARWLGIKLVPAFFCVLWQKNRTPSRVHRILHRLARPVFRSRSTVGIMSMSSDVTAQITQVAGGKPRPIYEFLPSYRRDTFETVAPPPAERRPFRVLFAGRIERKKGVFDLLEIAKRFERDGKTHVEFDLCGTGGAMDELQSELRGAGPAVASRFRIHGHCDSLAMRAMFDRSHVVIVPTRSEFVEGFNQVVAEGVLSGRPVVTSDVCPAVHYVRPAIVEVPADDVGGYADALLRLSQDESFYNEKVAACRGLAEPFYDVAHTGWATTLKTLLRKAGLLEVSQPHEELIEEPAHSV
jgi:glycosyltransferase involved in cell wall biosynthesis